MKDQVIKSIDDSIATIQLLKKQADLIMEAGEMIVNCLKDGGKLVLFGNGGSAADAQHIAAEFTGRSSRNRRPLPALALNTNTSAVTSIANDFGYAHVFERQVDALCARKDIAIAISTSGMSKNVLRGVTAARRKGAATIALTGETGTRLKAIVDLTIMVPSDDVARIQEAHILIGHIFAQIVDANIT